MVIRTSTAHEVQQLVDELRRDDAVRREAAIARLRVLGTRAVARLTDLVAHDPDATARIAGLKALEGISDRRVAGAAIGALSDADADVRRAAVTTLRGWLAEDEGARVLDALAGVALDRGQDPGVRAAARDALSQLPGPIVAPILAHEDEAAAPEAAAGEPRSLHEWIAAHEDAPLTALHALVARARDRESREPEDSRKREWLAARGAVHAALARRGSRVALYDLREAFEDARAALPGEFVTAVTGIGDATCLEPMARAWSRAAGDPEWQDQLSRGAAAIVRRLRLTGRHQVIRRLRKKGSGLISAGVPRK